MEQARLNLAYCQVHSPIPGRAGAYLAALERGADAPITNYALGINAFASRRFDEARIFLQKAADGAPERYQAKVAEILARMETGG